MVVVFNALRESLLLCETSGAPAKHGTLDHNVVQLTASGQELSRSALRAVLRLHGHPDNWLSKIMGITCPDDGAFLLVLSHGPRRLFLTQWPRQYFHTTCVQFGRSLATPQCRWGMNARAIRSKTLCVFRGRFHPYRWKGQAGAPDCHGGKILAQIRLALSPHMNLATLNYFTTVDDRLLG